MPAHDKAYLQQKLAELSYSRVLPPVPHSGRNHYHLLLMTEDYRSAASRYHKIGQDIEADRLLMVPFSQTAARVCAADRVRVASLKHVKELSVPQADQALIRVAENRGLVDWVRRDMREKAAAYRYALEQVTIEAPMREAIKAEQALIALESAQQTLDYWDGCGEGALPVPPPDAADATAPSRTPSASLRRARGTSSTGAGSSATGRRSRAGPRYLRTASMAPPTISRQASASVQCASAKPKITSRIVEITGAA